MHGTTFTQINRDPFARSATVRRIRSAGCCDWCGRDRGKLYQYGTLRDTATAPE